MPAPLAARPGRSLPASCSPAGTTAARLADMSLPPQPSRSPRTRRLGSSTRFPAAATVIRTDCGATAPRCWVEPFIGDAR
eukprot:CAMPEP_0183464452 /NCGR_PEP_ID=MMETSP0370-20130417/145434_1 /TAXON_ID=268820 /ORGANISM="Peridinium aciculiferum, Strain PAER-2" /LENGTH=79 /DNA_ID=CAMNT_0025656609 /DNA_START=22 /DNA_END=261 /DNA_ORIENTATION=-